MMLIKTRLAFDNVKFAEITNVDQDLIKLFNGH